MACAQNLTFFRGRISTSLTSPYKEQPLFKPHKTKVMQTSINKTKNELGGEWGKKCGF